jgi:hypothetical protein
MITSASKISDYETIFQTMQSKDNNDASQIKDSELQFPYLVYPDKLQSIILETNQTLGFPVEFISASMLYAFSVAIGNSYNIKAKNGWIESAVIYLVIASNAGTNKSAPLTWAIKPIRKRDAEYYKVYDSELKEWDQCEDKKSKPKPRFKKMIVSDVTQEALAGVHDYNKRGLGLYMDEIIGMIKNMNRYNKGSELEFWLSVFSGKSVSIDRKSDRSLLIEHPFISLAGTIQLGLLQDLAKDGMQVNGFLDRLLFVVAENLKKSHWLDAELNKATEQEYSAILNRVMDAISDAEPSIVDFTTDARSLFREWHREHTNRYNTLQDEQEKQILSKIEIYLIRFCLILEVMDRACKGENMSNLFSINVKSVQGAIELSNYFTQQALKVRSIISQEVSNDSASVKIKCYAKLPEQFTTSDGLVIAKALKMSERSFKSFLNDSTLFQKLAHGYYNKLN